jgi:hypothetical protein
LGIVSERSKKIIGDDGSYSIRENEIPYGAVFDAENTLYVGEICEI